MAKPALAIVRGCAVCDVNRRDMLVVPSGELLCRGCASRVGSFIRQADAAWLGVFWPPKDALPLPSGGGPLSVDAEKVCAELKERVAATLSPDDARAHYDLACAYAEMGLSADAVHEATFSLGDTVAFDRAQKVLDWMFDERHTRPDTFTRIVSALRASFARS